MNPPTDSRPSTLPLYVLFIISGAAGLVYEVIWMRMLAVTLGATAPAVAAVLAAFMGGLALGSWIGGRAVDRWGRPLRWYAGCELFIGVYALLFPLLHGGMDALGRAVYMVASPAAGETLRFAGAALILLLPTAAMGATTPAVTAALRERRGGGTGASFAGAYAANSLGAAAGVLIGGFWLLYTLGARYTLFTVAAINLAVAGAAFMLSRTPLPAVPSLGQAKAAVKGPAPAAAMLAAFLIGATALAAQILWMRALATIVGSAAYAFTAMLAVILLAIAAGAFIHRRLPSRVAAAPWFYAAACLVGAGALAANVYGLKLAPRVFLWAFGWAGGGYDVAVAVVFGLAFLLLFLPSLALGIVLPVAVAAVRRGAPGRRVGTIYAANTAGAIGGSLLGTFVLLPALGPVNGLRILALAALAAAFLFGLTKMRALWLIPGAAAAAAAALFIPGPTAHDLVLGAGISPEYYLDAGGELDLGDTNHEWLLFYRDSVDASVGVVAYGDIRSLKINGKSVASTNYHDLRVERMLGDLPAKALGDTRGLTCLVVGLGTGITAGSCAADPGLQRIVVVEINPAVPPASRFFDAWSGAPLDDPRVHLRRDDGRSYVRAAPERFNLVTSDPIHPWTKGSSSLYTVEHFHNCAALLPREGGGVMAQWLPLYQLSPADYFTVVRSFCPAFKYVALYYSGRDTVLLGHNGGAHWPEEYAPFMVAEGDALRRKAEELGRLNTEDNLVLEHTAPRMLYTETEPMNLDVLAALRPPGGDNHYRAITYLIDGRRWELKGNETAAESAYRRGHALWPANEDLRQGLADIYFERAIAAVGRGRADEGRRWFREVLRVTPADGAARENLKRLGG